MAGNIVELTDATFQNEVLDSEQPVLVDFWAPWCGPCRQLAPTMESLAQEFAGRVKIAKLNTDTEQDMAIKYKIDSIPTVILFKGGQIVDRLLGAHPKNRFLELLKKA